MNRNKSIVRYVTLAAACAVTLTISGCVDRLPNGVSCEGVRALRPEMKEADVERLIGPPTFGGQVMRGLPERQLHYERSWFGNIGHLVFVVRFENDTVTDVTSYYKYPWMSDLKYIYRVSADSRIEDPEFKNFFHCK